MSLPLFKKNLSVIWKPFVLILSILAMYGGVIIYMFDDKLAQTLEEYQKLMPELMKAMGMSGSMGNLTEFSNTYLHGFLLLLIPIIFTIIVLNQTVVRYIDNGSLANLLATGTSRMQIIGTQVVTLILSMIVFLALNAIITIGFAEYFFPGELDTTTYLKLAGMILLLHLAISGFSFCVACFVNDSAKYYLFGAGIPFLFYLIQMMSNMGGQLEKLKYITIFTLFPDQKILAGESVLLESIILLVIMAITCGIGIFHFKRRDFSL